MSNFNKKEADFSGGGGGHIEITGTKNPNEIILEKWDKLASSDSLSEAQKKMGGEWIDRLVNSDYTIHYTDPESEFFGYDERKVLCTADRNSCDTRDLMDLLNATGEVEVSVYTDAEIEQLIRNEARKRPPISVESLMLRKKEINYLESLKNSVILRSRKKMPEEILNGLKNDLKKAGIIK